MATVICQAVKNGEVKQRSKASIEWYDENNKPQYYCCGYNDASTEELIDSCKNCPDLVCGEKYENDFKDFQKRLGLGALPYEE
ncbi:hypothetical protein [Sulfurimonas sp.]|uniref:hypothetical protein n=1 Tax=Sulfurimonas sp. TaxID=2022749 RepID=UPI003D095CE1